jgi:hypothetical protein
LLINISSGEARFSPANRLTVAGNEAQDTAEDPSDPFVVPEQWRVNG